jgi:hypothetical protein
MSGPAAAAPLPRIVVRDPPRAPALRIVEELAGLNAAGALVLLLTHADQLARDGLRSLARSLIDEGRRYAQTDAGRRWAELLEASPAVTNGWLLWNQANVDFYLRNAEPLAENPARLLEAALRELAQADLAQLLAQLSRASAEVDANLRAGAGP